MGEKDGDRVCGRPTGKRGRDVVSPKLKSEGGDGRRRGCIGYAGGLKVEGAKGEIGGSGPGRNKWEEGVRRRVVCSGREKLVFGGLQEESRGYIA